MAHVGSPGPAPVLRLGLHEDQLLLALSNLDQVHRVISVIKYNGGNTMLKDGLDELVTIRTVFDGLHKHMGRRQGAEGMLELHVVGHAEERLGGQGVESPRVLLPSTFRHLLGLNDRAGGDICDKPQGEVAGTRAPGIEGHPLCTDQCAGAGKLANVIVVLLGRYLNDNIIGRKSGLLEVGKVQETEVAGLEHHAGLAIHAVGGCICEIKMSIVCLPHLENNAIFLKFAQDHGLGRVVPADDVRVPRAITGMPLARLGVDIASLLGHLSRPALHTRMYVSIQSNVALLEQDGRHASKMYAATSRLV